MNRGAAIKREGVESLEPGLSLPTERPSFRNQHGAYDKLRGNLDDEREKNCDRR